MEDHWNLGRWGRIPVAMHWTVLLAFAWMYLFFWSLPLALVAAAAFFVLLIVHEMGHVAVLRARKIPVVGITLFGVHGRTDHGYASPRDEMIVAWGGVGAQLVLLALAVAVQLAVAPRLPLWATAYVWSPVLMVFTELNIFVMVIALLPIGPFDGRAAWRVFPYWRSKLRRRKRRPVAKPVEIPSLTPEQQRELEETSEKAAAELIDKISRRK